MDWTEIFATCSQRVKASEIHEFSKLLVRPDITSFAGTFPINLFPEKTSCA